MVDLLNVTLISLALTWVLVIGTLFLMYWQTLQTQRLNSANAVMTLRERFDGGRMRQARRHLSERLLHEKHEDIASMEVVTFFELVGTLTHRKVLDSELVWEAFGTWISAYYYALRQPIDLIGQLRTSLEDPLVFHEFEWLQEKLIEIDRKMMGPASLTVRNELEDSRRILQREVSLESI
jgi:hypothetical protein